jgi:predicted  nucleic acid-binding Zn ribbon protein
MALSKPKGNMMDEDLKYQLKEAIVDIFIIACIPVALIGGIIWDIYDRIKNHHR